jgi:hypothetical protein
MKKLLFLFITVIAISLFTTNCSKVEDNEYYFYSTIDSNTVPLSLYINNEYKGQIPILNNYISYDSLQQLDQTLYVLLSGNITYNIVAKDSFGLAQSIFVIELKSKKGSSSTYLRTQKGGNDMFGFDNKLVVRIYKQ